MLELDLVLNAFLERHLADLGPEKVEVYFARCSSAAIQSCWISSWATRSLLRLTSASSLGSCVL